MTDSVEPDPNAVYDPLVDGEILTVGTPFTWVNPVRIEAGESMVPLLLRSAKARSFAALHLVSGDLSFATQCLSKAYARGKPDISDIEARALISAGVIAYARCFKTGVRIERLNADTLSNSVAGFDLEIHEYLIALRDKHVAHSVNNFEDAETFAMTLASPQAQLRDAGAVGAIIKQSIGIARLRVRKAIAHISSVMTYVDADLDTRRHEVYAEFKESFEKGETFAAAPLLKATDPKSVWRSRDR